MTSKFGRVYCINHQCKKHSTCVRHVDKPVDNSDNICFQEIWNNKECNKYRNKESVSNPEPSHSETPIGFMSSIPQEMELREHLIHHVRDNLDKVFDGDSNWKRETHEYGKIASRLVDLLMPTITAKKKVKPQGYR